MKKLQGGKLKAVGVVVLALAISGASLLVSQARGIKICPIEFTYKHGTLLETNLAAHIEKANAQLAVLLANLRGMRMVDPEMLKKIEGEFSKTYLKNPILQKEDKTTYEGWAAVAPALLEIVNSMTFVNVQAVDVLMEYLPRASRSNPDIDFRAIIQTHLACAPDDCTTIRGTAEHRTMCPWEP